MQWYNRSQNMIGGLPVRLRRLWHWCIREMSFSNVSVPPTT